MSSHALWSKSRLQQNAVIRVEIFLVHNVQFVHKFMFEVIEKPYARLYVTLLDAVK